jgi:hypothetical protein
VDQYGAENLENEAVIAKVAKAVEELCSQYPVPELFVKRAANQ